MLATSSTRRARLFRGFKEAPGVRASHHAIDMHLNPRFLSYLVSYDVASKICPALRHGTPRG